MAVTVVKTTYSDGEPNAWDEFADANYFSVGDGHLTVRPYMGTTDVTAIYAPGHWEHVMVTGAGVHTEKT